MTGSLWGQFLQNSNYFNVSSSGNGIMFIMAGFSFAIVWNENACYFFDSHSRDINAFPSLIGTLVLLKFGSVYEVQEYISEVYFAQASNMLQYYQIQYLIAVPPVEVWHFILKTLGRKWHRETSIAKGTQLIPSACVTIREQSHKRQQKRHSKLSELRKMISPSKTHYIKSLKEKRTLRKKWLRSLRRKLKRALFTSVACNRTWYKQTVQIFQKNNYQVEMSSVFHYMVCSTDGKLYICITCHEKLLKGTVPGQAVCNDFQIFELPSRFCDFWKLEKIIIPKQLLFKKVTMFKSECPKIKGAICNVP